MATNPTPAMSSNAAATESNVFIASVDFCDFGIISCGYPAAKDNRRDPATILRGNFPVSASVLFSQRCNCGRRGWDGSWKELRRGWYVGGEAFRKQLADDLEKAAKGRRRESHSGPARAAHDEAAAKRHLQQALRALGWKTEHLADSALAAPEKLALACWLRQNTTVSLRWISQRLQMGHYTRVTQALSRTRQRPGPTLRRLGKKLKALENDLQPNLL